MSNKNINHNFEYADLHCHPNLKTFGHSFDKNKSSKKQNVWFYQPPVFFTKLINTLLGITRFSQSDFTTLSKGGAKIIFASLYPFEKGFFINSAGKGPLSAWLSDLITGIGYQRVRYIQKHTNYFEDLEKEYRFFYESKKSCEISGKNYKWNFVSNQYDLEKTLVNENEIAVLMSIEGAHVFNSGLSEYGRLTSEQEILKNIQKMKQWKFPPVYITFAHNFNNDLCGHAHSLEPIKKFVDQEKGMNTGFTELGKKVLHELLSSKNGKPVYIDIKHMSHKSRKEYFKILENEYNDNLPPTIVSHGAVNGLSEKKISPQSSSEVFYPSDINFYDEEIELIGLSGGLFAIQFDSRRIAQRKLVKKRLKSLVNKENPSIASNMIWLQIQYIAEVLDKKNIFGWGTACIGSDYDGTIDPLPGVWTAEYFPTLYKGILSHAKQYLKNPNPLILEENKSITPEEITSRFFLDNTIQFIHQYFK